jgi:hypothetical protein
MSKEKIIKSATEIKDRVGDLAKAVKGGIDTSKQALQKASSLIDKKKIGQGMDLLAKGAKVASQGAKVVASQAEKASEQIKKVSQKLKD